MLATSVLQVHRTQASACLIESARLHGDTLLGYRSTSKGFNAEALLRTSTHILKKWANISSLPHIQNHTTDNHSFSFHLKEACTLRFGETLKHGCMRCVNMFTENATCFFKCQIGLAREGCLCPLDSGVALPIPGCTISRGRAEGVSLHADL